MTENRIYIVTTPDAKGETYLVRAQTSAQAIRYVSKKHFEAKVATQDECIQCACQGVKVEDASAEQN